MALAALWHGLGSDLLGVRASILLNSELSRMLARKDVRLSCIRLIPGISGLLRFRSTIVREAVPLWRRHPRNVSNSTEADVHLQRKERPQCDSLLSLSALAVWTAGFPTACPSCEWLGKRTSPRCPH